MDNSLFKILIVDDNAKNLQILGNLLEKSNYQVEYALSGAEALEWVKTVSFDLILLDIMMPKMDGFEVCSIIRKDEKYNDTPIIFLTAKTDKESIVKGFELNAQDYVSKPFDSAELLARISTHIELKSNRDKLKNLNKWLEEKVDEKTKELKKANEKLEETLTELRSLDKMKSYFLNLTSTEIRAPLTGILGTMHLLKNQEVSFALKDLLQLLEESVSKLESFANKAILTTELSSKTYDFKPEVANIKDIFQYCLIDLNDCITEKEIEVVNEVNDAKINVDKDLIFKALFYLLKNAIDHSDKRSKIEFKVRETELNTSILIRDFGKGFSNEAINDMYSPYRFNEKDFHKKNDLSMYLVKLIMDYHNGEFKAYNAENTGACVELIFNK